MWRRWTTLESLLRAGADKVAVNSAAVSRPALIGELAAEFGSQCVVAAVDSRQGLVFTHGGRRATDLETVAWAAECARLGAGEILLTSMDRDGTRAGFDLVLTRSVVDAVDVPVVASGGVGTLDDLVAGAVEGGADAVLAASMFHFRQHSVAEAKAHLAAAGVTVRPVGLYAPSRVSPSEVEPGPTVHTFGGNRVNVAFSQQDVVVALNLDLVAILRAEQNLVAGLDVAHMGTGGDDFGPDEPLAHLGGRRNEDSTFGSTLAL